MDLDIQLKKDDVTFAQVQTIVEYILNQGYRIDRMHIQAQ